MIINNARFVLVIFVLAIFSSLHSAEIISVEHNLKDSFENYEKLGYEQKYLLLTRLYTEPQQGNLENLNYFIDSIPKFKNWLLLTDFKTRKRIFENIRPAVFQENNLYAAVLLTDLVKLKLENLKVEYLKTVEYLQNLNQTCQFLINNSGSCLGMFLQAVDKFNKNKLTKALALFTKAAELGYKKANFHKIEVINKLIEKAKKENCLTKKLEYSKKLIMLLRSLDPQRDPVIATDLALVLIDNPQLQKVPFEYLSFLNLGCCANKTKAWAAKAKHVAFWHLDFEQANIYLENANKATKCPYKIQDEKKYTSQKTTEIKDIKSFCEEKGAPEEYWHRTREYYKIWVEKKILHIKNNSNTKTIDLSNNNTCESISNIFLAQEETLQNFSERRNQRISKDVTTRYYVLLEQQIKQELSLLARFLQIEKLKISNPKLAREKEQKLKIERSKLLGKIKTNPKNLDIFVVPPNRDEKFFERMQVYYDMQFRALLKTRLNKSNNLKKIMSRIFADLPIKLSELIRIYRALENIKSKKLPKNKNLEIHNIKNIFENFGITNTKQIWDTNN